MGLKTAAVIYTDSKSAINVSSYENIPFDNIISCNKCVSLGDNKIKIKAPGIYKINFNSTAIATKKGDIELVLNANGNPLSGSRGIETAQASGEKVNIAFNRLITIKPSYIGNTAELTVVSTDTTSIIVSNIVIVKIA